MDDPKLIEEESILFIRGHGIYIKWRITTYLIAEQVHLHNGKAWTVEPSPLGVLNI
ncbi:unnamed protein product [Sphenostylis stenocarpa]|uniref:Uncharacterized protein n=1 Tax=Sphenostylis stenocarpa TaxID=92480 RepID=A0AA86S769_9FABA|nr:unnamed protein product [Sphenostylis stenocarpa]